MLASANLSFTCDVSKKPLEKLKFAFNHPMKPLKCQNNVHAQNNGLIIIHLSLNNGYNPIDAHYNFIANATSDDLKHTSRSLNACIYYEISVSV